MIAAPQTGLREGAGHYARAESPYEARGTITGAGIWGMTIDPLLALSSARAVESTAARSSYAALLVSEMAFKPALLS